MKKTSIAMRSRLRFCRFTRKCYGLFSVLGREVLIGTLSVATLSHAKAEGVSTRPEFAADSLQRNELKLDEIVVTGSRAPLTQAEAAKIVTVISREDIDRAAVTSINDILKLATGVDVRQRGGFGVQTDITVRGGNYDQITILLNGINISSPQTGHLSADFPLNADDIERVEVLEGPEARVYGTSAFNGVVNIVTKNNTPQAPREGGCMPPTDSSFRVGGYGDLSGGSYGYANASAGIDILHRVGKTSPLQGGLGGLLSHHVSGGYSRSDGATPNSDFSSMRLFYTGNYHVDNISVDAQLGYSYKPYGANTFYGASSSDQWESNERWMAALKGNIGFKRGQTSPLTGGLGGITGGLGGLLYWNRWNDHYQWHKGVTPSGENYHQTDVYGVGINSWFETSLGKTALGVELRNEGIWSTNLGTDLDPSKYRNVAGHDGNGDRQYTKRDQRTNVSAFLEHNILLRQWTLSFGLLATHNTGLDAKWRVYPGIDIAYRPDDHWKLLTSWSMALRMPTFTEMYYSTQGVNIEGNKDLKPEKTSDFQIGARYTIKGFIGEFQAFYSHKTDMIDWVTTPDYYKETTVFNGPAVETKRTYIYHSLNFRSDNIGYELNLRFLPQEVWGNRCPLRKVGLQYAYLNENTAYNVTVLQSKYAMEYLRHKVVITADGRLYKRLNIGLSWRFHDRVGENNPSYALLDGKLSWDERHWALYAEATNILNKQYYDYQSIPQPGFQIIGGVKLRF